MRFAFVRMIVADLVLAVALDVAVLVTMLAARIVLRLLGLRWLGVRDSRVARRRSGRSRASGRSRRASHHAGKRDQTRDHQNGVWRTAHALLLIRHSLPPHGFHVSQPKLSGTILQPMEARWRRSARGSQVTGRVDAPGDAKRRG